MRHDHVSIDNSARLVDQVQRAIANKEPLRIRGGDSKAFLGRAVEAEALDTRGHRGIVNYDPSELVVTVRAGTPLAELEEILDEAGQMLPCEPPSHGATATVGGTVATGLSGPRRPWAGAVRDFVLGCRIVTGQGKHLRFGGQVMKNVAGYDVSRLMSGSFGCLGLITEVSLKVLPKPRETKSIMLALEASEAMRELDSWRKASLPVAGACHVDGYLHVRFEGGAGSVGAAVDRIGGEHLHAEFWADLRELRLPFFDDDRPLWRLSLPNNTPLVDLPGATLLDWGGAQRWLKSDADADSIRAIASAAGGHATCFTPGVSAYPFQPLPAPVMRIHQQLKERLDPHGVFNPGRMYADY
ncbi:MULTISPECIES: glycolate oxidase subunit GlcE [unclassified Caballeronia]|uniref:glycolate oxidase subunit GlcE n=1 Tax=unclassified Caballeronia TaxID=2646786 RepID=UPI0020290C30|nr:MULTISPECIES: glycolate oxidase subunit GlcE [unclassified Caballeronia]